MYDILPTETLYTVMIYDILPTETLCTVIMYHILPTETLCTVIVPILLGMARALGRSSPDTDPLISVLYPSQSTVKKSAVARTEPEVEKTVTAFRSILPRTMSSQVLNLDPQTPASPNGMPVLEFPTYRSRER